MYSFPLLTKKTVFLLALLMLARIILPPTVQAQGQTATLTGRVIDAKTGQPLPFATVYLNNTTRGATADENGLYKLPNIPLGDVELVGSMLGYQPARQRLRLAAAQTYPTDLRLAPSANNLAAVTVKARHTKAWARQLRTFTGELLGNRPEARQCRIVNPNVLSFDEPDGHLLAVASEPLIIENNALGYRLHYNLQHFDLYRRKLLFAGAVRFEELKSTDNRQELRWNANRLKAYRGTIHHLMASLLSGTHEQEGFTVYHTPLAQSDNEYILPLVRTADRKLINRQAAQNLFKPGDLPFEKRFVSNEPLEVYYNRVRTDNSPYRDSPGAYSLLMLPNRMLLLNTNGWITQSNGLDVRGYMGDDRLSTLLPSDWIPTDKETLQSTNIVAGRPLRADAHLDSLIKLYQQSTRTAAPLVYIHTDKMQYAAGEFVWMSAYVVDAVHHLPVMTEAGTLEVMLVEPSGKLVQHQYLRLREGRAAGVVPLPDTLTSGTYRLIATTPANQSESPAFEERLTVYNPRQPLDKMVASLPQSGPQISTTVKPATQAQNAEWLLLTDATSDSSQVKVTVRATGNNREQPVYITLESRNQLVYRQKWQLSKGEVQFSLPTLTLPPGVSRLTLRDSSNQLQTERLVFIPDRSEPVLMQIGRSKVRYAPREQVSISLVFRDAEGYPVSTIWSAAVTDADWVPGDSNRADMRTHLFLTHALKDYIASPAYFFNHPKELDSLLQHQTWRAPIPSAVNDSTGGWALSGQARDKEGQPLAGKKITLLLTQKNAQVLRHVMTDERGRFRLTGLTMTDTVRVQTAVSGVQGSNVVFESVAEKVSFLPTSQPILNPPTLNTSHTDSTASDLRNAYSQLVMDSLVASPASSQNTPDLILTIDDTNPFRNVFELLKGRMPGATITSVEKDVYTFTIQDFGDFGSAQHPPLYLLDGVFVDQESLLRVDTRNIARIELFKKIFPNSPVCGNGGVMAVFTRKENGAASLLPTGSSTLVYGFRTSPPFPLAHYSQSMPSATADRRNVLFWQPLGQSRSDGQARLTFPLNDTTRRLRIMVQGLTVEGSPIFFSWVLTVR